VGFGNKLRAFQGAVEGTFSNVGSYFGKKAAGKKVKY
jgi:hypothetical protein